jgi:hypothetical protein
MDFVGSLYGGGGSNIPQYDTAKAKEMFQWQQNQARYNVSNPYASMTWDPNTNTQQTSYSPQMQGVLDSLFGGDASTKRAEDSVFSAFSNRYEPIFDRQSNNLQDRLVNQGIPVGSEAYSRAMSDMNNSQNDARLQAMNQATLTGQQQANANNANNLSIFSAFNPLNGYSAGAGTPNTDIYGNAYAGSVNAYNQQNANRTAQNTGIMDMLNSGLSMFGISDARIKENLRPVGQLFNGLTVYAFNFPGDETTRIGLVAQEVEELLPQAVAENAEGLLMVNYDLATQYEGEGQEQEGGEAPQAEQVEAERR